jgi:large conductance mechanosensitive channel
MFKEFKEFAIKGNVLDLAIGVIIGAAFSSIINSLVNDIFNPVLGVFIGNVDLSKWTLGLPGDGVLRLGAFLNAVINFLIVSFAIFLMVRQINRFKRKPQEATNTKECHFCSTIIPIGAVRCPNCTSQLA